jgi:hypothetical protein
MRSRRDQRGQRTGTLAGGQWNRQVPNPKDAVRALPCIVTIGILQAAKLSAHSQEIAGVP